MGCLEARSDQSSGPQHEVEFRRRNYTSYGLGYDASKPTILRVQSRRFLPNTGGASEQSTLLRVRVSCFILWLPSNRASSSFGAVLEEFEVRDAIENVLSTKADYNMF